MNELNHNNKSVTINEKLHLNLKDGYSVIELLSALALDFEASRLHHGLDGNEFKDRCKHKSRRYFSLRDKNDNPHVTLEINEKTITQVYGQYGKIPALNYFIAMKPFFKMEDAEFFQRATELGFVMSQDFEIYPLSELPDGLKVKGDLDVRFSSLKRLPKNLSVSGSLHIYKTEITSLPENLAVNGFINLSGSNKITNISPGLTVGGDLFLYDIQIDSLPYNLKVGGGLYLARSTILKLPAGLDIGFELDISHTQITSIPDDIKLGGSLHISGTNISSLPDAIPDNIHVTKDFVTLPAREYKKTSPGVTQELANQI